MIILVPVYTSKALIEAAQGFVLFPQWPSEAALRCFLSHMPLLKACLSGYLLLLLFLVLAFCAE